jgi:hypothetical protein
MIAPYCRESGLLLRSLEGEYECRRALTRREGCAFESQRAEVSKSSRS